MNSNKNHDYKMYLLYKIKRLGKYIFTNYNFQNRSPFSCYYINRISDHTDRDSVRFIEITRIQKGAARAGSFGIK
mgnify:CR=1 FL=1